MSEKSKLSSLVAASFDASNDKIVKLEAENKKMKSHLDFLKSKGLTVGLLKSSDCPEGKLAYVIEPESELCNLKLIHRVIDAEREVKQLKEKLQHAGRDYLISMNPNVNSRPIAVRGDEKGEAE